MAVWPAGTHPSSTALRLFRGAMERPARLFLCAGCRVRVVLCSHCDRGNRYCSRPCWRRSRDAARRDAGRRYQSSLRGRLAHAERSRRWRQGRAASGACADASTGDGHGVDRSHERDAPGFPDRGGRCSTGRMDPRHRLIEPGHPPRGARRTRHRARCALDLPALRRRAARPGAPGLPAPRSASRSALAAPGLAS